MIVSMTTFNASIDIKRVDGLNTLRPHASKTYDIIWSDNGLLPIRHHAIIYTNAR